MEAVGWTLLKDTSWAVRAETKDNRLVVYVTDLTALWRYEKTSTELFELNKKRNSVEIAEEKLVKELRSHIANGKYFQVQVKSDDTISLQLETVILGKRPFVWDFLLVKTRAEEFGIYVIRPMLAIIKNSSEVVGDLCAELIRKDKQIDEYKAAGGVVTKRLQTNDFIKDQYFKKRSLKTVENLVKTDPVSVFCDISQMDENKYNIYDQIVAIIHNSKTEMEVNRFNSTSSPASASLPVRGAVSSALGIKSTHKAIKSPIKKETEENRQKDLNKRLADDEVKSNSPSKQGKRGMKLF